MKDDKPNDIASRNLGIIAQRCLHHWRTLPPSVRDGYDPEDMIGDVVLHVVTVSSQYDPRRSSQVTWVWWIANNKCLAIVTKYRAKKRGADLMVPLPEDFDLRDATDALHGLESRNVVEQTIRSASESARDLLGSILSRSNRKIVRERDVRDLRSAAQQNGAGLDDFLLVYRTMTA